MPSPKPESRVFDRRTVTVLTVCKPDFAGQPSSVTVKNLSRGGVGLLATRQFDVGTTLIVEIHGNLKMVSVTHARHEGTQWYLGCRFLGRLTDTEFAALVGPEDDLRKEERHTMALVTTCQPKGEATFAAEIRNVSRDGIGLLAAQPVEVDGTVSIELRGTTRIARVSFIRKEEGHELWLIGCQFVESLTQEELASVAAAAAT